MTALFVTGAGTGVGKTYATALLIRQLRAQGRPARAVKPVMSGYDPATAETSDSGVLLAAMGETVSAETVAAISPWRYAAPLAPNMAARREGRRIVFDRVLAFCFDELHRATAPLLIEGIGGAMAPVTDDRTVLDWMAALGVPALLVSGSYLGAISHALTAVEALRARGVPLTGVVVSESEDGVDLADTVEALTRFLTGEPIVALPRGGTTDLTPFCR